MTISGNDAPPPPCLAAAAVLARWRRCGLPRPGADAGRSSLSPHRAVYELTLGKARGKSPVQSARGRILYDFSGSACEGYALEFRQVAELDNGEGKVTLSDLRSNTWEDGAAQELPLHLAELSQSEPARCGRRQGRAQRRRRRRHAHQARADKKVDLDAAIVFPTEHVRRIIDAAREGKTILEFPIYDGSETGEKVYNTLTVIGREIAPGERDLADAAAGNKVLAGMQRWPVTVSYFERNKPTRRADAGLCDLVRALRERRLARAGARLQRLLDQRRAEEDRDQGRQALSVKSLDRHSGSRRCGIRRTR